MFAGYIFIYLWQFVLNFFYTFDSIEPENSINEKKRWNLLRFFLLLRRPLFSTNDEICALPAKNEFFSVIFQWKQFTFHLPVSFLGSRTEKLLHINERNVFKNFMNIIKYELLLFLFQIWCKFVWKKKTIKVKQQFQTGKQTHTKNSIIIILNN